MKGGVNAPSPEARLVFCALVIACCGIFFSTLSTAQVYRCTVNGGVIYSDRPCDAKRAATQVRKADPRTSWDPAKHGGETYEAHRKSQAQGDLIECLANEYNAWYRAQKPRRPTREERKARMAEARQDCRRRFPEGIVIPAPPPRQASGELDAFRSAIASRKLAEVKALLDAGVDPNADFTGPSRPRGRSGTPALIFAISSSSEEIAHLLVERGAVVSAVNSRGDTPLHVAAGAGHVETMALLLSRGADIAAGNVVGYTPLHFAIHGMKLEAVKYLVAKGAPINAQAGRYGTPLTNAIRGNSHNDRLPIIRHLLDAGADPNIPDAYGDYPLHIAITGRADRPMIEVIAALMKAGARLQVLNKRGETPLALARRLGRSEVEGPLR